LSEFLEALGLDEESYGIFYTDIEPTEGFVPTFGQPLSLELEHQGKVNYQDIFSNFSCVLGKVWLARRKKAAAYFEAERYGCPGGSFYLGFYKPNLDILPLYISTGVPGTTIHGERYFSSPEVARRWFAKIDPRPAPARFCVFKPISHFSADERPELVTFFARGEVLEGLCNLAAFVTDDFEIVANPFGAGCSFMVTWPLHYLTQGKARAVLGCGDPSARKFMKPDEMTFTVPYGLYEGFLSRWRDSFLETDTWRVVKKKIVRSKKAWGELPGGSPEQFSAEENDDVS
jgi:uncharacterized protein (DUF169 family)